MRKSKLGWLYKIEQPGSSKGTSVSDREKRRLASPDFFWNLEAWRIDLEGESLRG
jgi:hypothetical protein